MEVILLASSYSSGVSLWIDSVNSERQGQLVGSIPFDTSIGGHAGFRLTGETANTNGILFNEPLLAAAGPYSLGMWLYRTGDASSIECQVAKNADATWETGVRFHLDEGNNWRPGIQGFKGTSGNPNFIVQSTSGSVPLNTWKHVVWQWDGTTSAAGIAMYVDGQLVGSGAASTSLSTATMASDNFFIGPGEPGRGFVGKVASVEIYSRALTPDEVALNYAAHSNEYIG